MLHVRAATAVTALFRLHVSPCFGRNPQRLRGTSTSDPTPPSSLPVNNSKVSGESVFGVSAALRRPIFLPRFVDALPDKESMPGERAQLASFMRRTLQSTSPSTGVARRPEAVWSASGRPHTAQSLDQTPEPGTAVDDERLLGRQDGAGVHRQAWAPKETWRTEWAVVRSVTNWRRVSICRHDLQPSRQFSDSKPRKASSDSTLPTTGARLRYPVRHTDVPPSDLR